MAELFSGGHLRFLNGEWRDDNGDPVEIEKVVRCKDCKYYDPAHNDCELEREAHGSSGIRHIDDFCSYGERKDNEHFQETV